MYYRLTDKIIVKIDGHEGCVVRAVVRCKPWACPGDEVMIDRLNAKLNQGFTVSKRGVE